MSTQKSNNRKYILIVGILIVVMGVSTFAAFAIHANTKDGDAEVAGIILSCVTGLLFFLEILLVIKQNK